MTKEKSKLAREVDEEGYFKYLLDRDLKRRKLYGFARIFSKVLKGLTHLCFWIHWYEETHEKIAYEPPDEDGREYAQIWKCTLCGAEATNKVTRWECFKLVFGTVGIVLSIFIVPYTSLPIIGLLNPTLILLLWAFPIGGVISILYRIAAMKV